MKHNPFSVTKADDYNDDEILRFWVEVPSGEDSAGSLLKPLSPMPVFLLGAKGSGKTHLMRFHCFPLQSLRCQAAGTSLIEGISKEGYLGLYVRCSGLNSGRFNGKRKDAETWHAVFAYYMEIWLARRSLDILSGLMGELDSEVEEVLVADILALFDTPVRVAEQSVRGLISMMEVERKHLDSQINNCVLTGKLDVDVKVSSGALVFGIPKLVSRHCKPLSEIIFLYLIDEVESLSASQQTLINSFVRDRELPTTFRVGARLHGIKTRETWSDGEEIVPDSEFVRIVMDEELREAPSKYAKFSRNLLDKRLAEGGAAGRVAQELVGIQCVFEEQDEAWNSAIYLDVVKDKASEERQHFKKLTQQLADLQIKGQGEIVSALSQARYPLLEKAGILMFYRQVHRGRDAVQSARLIGKECRAFVEEGSGAKEGRRVRSLIEHYKTDLVAQLRRENDAKQLYLGLGSFIAMSGGLPRALLTILRRVFEWSIYNDENPFGVNGISTDSQYRGVNEASEWFFSSMRQSGRDGAIVQAAIERFAQMCRENRFADRPVECSLNSFSVSLQTMSQEAQEVLELCQQRSFINSIAGGQKGKNTREVQVKYQLHPMLSPRWQLPLGRRGAMPLSGEVANLVFDPSQQGRFEEWIRRFRRQRSFAAPEVGDRLL